MAEQFDRFQFLAGDAFNAHDFFGVEWQGEPEAERATAIFRVYAPASPEVQLVSDLDDWQGQSMTNEGDGIWSIEVQDVPQGLFYKYKIQRPDGSWQLKADPYATAAEMPPGTASRVQATQYAYQWGDDGWMKDRVADVATPLNIYEMHLGSWKMGEDGSLLGYREIAPLLIDYLNEMHFTHVEFLPILEHEFYGSWGYQTSCYFAPSARYGEPEDLKYLVDQLHQAGYGVIFDYVPTHFISNIEYLREFDGTALYEYMPSDIAVSQWGSINFNYYNGAVRSFLQSSAERLLSHFHADGLRIDAVSNAIYWMGDEERGVNPGAVHFLQSFNRGLRSRHPDVYLIAEDSSSFPGVTLSAVDGGLDFHYKWDLGWMHDTLNYFRTPPEERAEAYNKLSFGMMYFRDERYLLAFSHDEVVHGKATIAQKMWGDYEDKFPQLRVLYAYMYTYPGKKLQFMGNEIAHFREWDETREQDWDLLKYPIHDAFKHYFSALNDLYKSTPALFADDYEESGFRWLEVHAPEQGFYAFERAAGDARVIFAMNTLNQPLSYDLSPDLDPHTSLRLLLSSEEDRWGGKREGTPVGDALPESDAPFTFNSEGQLHLELLPFEAVIFACDGENEA